MLVEKLLDEDKKMMERYIDCYALYDNSHRTASIDYILRFWDDQKSEYLYRLLGGQFIISKTIEVTKDKDEICDDIETRVFGWNKPGDKFKNDLCEKFRSMFVDEDRLYRQCWYSLEDLQSYYDNASKGAKCANYEFLCFRHLFDNDILATNIYTGPTFELNRPEWSKALKIQKGCKASKALGQIAKALQVDGFEQFRIAHSQCLNEKKFKGQLVLSIHPMDFMTMSDNGNGWQSCMNWTDGGEYRRGTVEMMNSRMVVCAYMTSSEKFSPCYGVEWNSKKWRELFIVGPDLICGIKGYPFWNRDLEKQTIMFIRELAQNNLGWGPYNSIPVKMKSGGYFDVEEFGHTYSAEFYTNAMYNDMYSEHYAIVSQYAPNHMEISYSGVGNCMCCGKADYDVSFYGEGSLCCDDCDTSSRCDYCDDRYDASDLYEVDGQYLCPDCYSEHAVECPACGETHLDDNMRQIFLGFKGTWELMWHINANICDDCWTRLEDKFNVAYIYNGWYDNVYYFIDVEDVSSDLWDAFGFTSIKDFEDCYKDNINTGYNRYGFEVKSGSSKPNDDDSRPF